VIQEESVYVFYIHTYQSRLIPEGVAEASQISSETPTFYQNVKPITVWLQTISGRNPLVAFYDIHERKREVLFFYFIPDTTWESLTPHKTLIDCDKNDFIPVTNGSKIWAWSGMLYQQFLTWGSTAEAWSSLAALSMAGIWAPR
jgi:hypothetical protein